MNYLIKTKIEDGWRTLGSVKVNKWGKLQASFKNSELLKKLVNEGGEWLNFALFEDKPKAPAPSEDEDLPF